MTKKRNFGAGIEAILGSMEEEQSPKEKPLSKEKPIAEVRTTLMIDIDLAEKMKAVAYWQRKPMKLVLTDALNQYYSSLGDKKLQEAIDCYSDRTGA